MTYLLEFKPTALKEWSKLDNSVIDCLVYRTVTKLNCVLLVIG